MQMTKSDMGHRLITDEWFLLLYSYTDRHAKSNQQIQTGPEKLHHKWGGIWVLQKTVNIDSVHYKASG